jgi:hypothetical protein
MDDITSSVDQHDIDETAKNQLIVTILDTVTGSTVQCSDSMYDAYWWVEGEGSCDCIRKTLFGHDPYGGYYCDGCRRYLVVDCVGEMDDYILHDFNIGYSPELVAKHLRPMTKQEAYISSLRESNTKLLKINLDLQHHIAELEEELSQMIVER